MDNFFAAPTDIYYNTNVPNTFIPQTYATLYPPHVNEYVYLRQPASVHVNPHFNKNVFVNPNFQNSSNIIPPVTKIHINPNLQTVQSNSKQIHVNPNVIPTSLASGQNKSKQRLDNTIQKQEDIKRTVYSSRTKLIRTPVKTKSPSEVKKLRRNSIRSKFKIVKAHILNRSQTDTRKTKSPILHKYKLVRYKTLSTNKTKGNTFKIDNRNKDDKIQTLKTKKLSFTYDRETTTNKALSLVKIGGVLYRKSTNKLQKANTIKRSSIVNKRISKSKYKIVRWGKTKSSDLQASLVAQKVVKRVKVKISKNGKTVSPGKLRKCNIPCPYFKKFGRCKRHETGKCFRKHDPDQVALCTKFLQGACLNDKCLLSHNVSLEKMPTCKFYLEGNCSKDRCTYLHVRISPKADICKDFLEGFCKKGAECDKRHQYLCPEYEKTGKCPKQRCAYPHGKMVRKYSVFDKNKFAKKCSENNSETVSKLHIGKSIKKNVIITENTEVAAASRYYTDKKTGEDVSILDNLDNINEPTMSIGARPKLGKLPSFIAFES